MEDDLEYLESYLITKYETTIIFGKDEKDAFYFNDNCIGINTGHTKEIQLFCLLHEAGHLMLRGRDDFEECYPDVQKTPRTQRSRVDTIKEEIDAWTEGRKLAKFLDIEIDDKKWNRYWKRQVYKYVKWAVEKER